jgi:hypothetical protein
MRSNGLIRVVIDSWHPNWLSQNMKLNFERVRISSLNAPRPFTQHWRTYLHEFTGWNRSASTKRTVWTVLVICTFIWKLLVLKWNLCLLKTKRQSYRNLSEFNSRKYLIVPTVGYHWKFIGIRSLGPSVIPQPGIRWDFVGSSDPTRSDRARYRTVSDWWTWAVQIYK